MIGIYQFRNTVNKKAYIGSSVEVTKRKENHIHSLRKGKHHNIHFQRAWDKYGEDSFEYKVLEYLDSETSTDKLLEREQYWLDKTKCYETEHGYNILRIAGSNKGHKWSLQAKENFSKIRKGLKLKISDETRRKLSFAKRKENLSDATVLKYIEGNRGELSPNSKLKEKEVVEIKIMLSKNTPRKSIAEYFNCSIKTIDKIAIGENWGWLDVEGFTVNKKEKTILSELDVREIKKALMDNESTQVLAEQYSVTKKVIQTIKRGEKWKNICVDGYEEFLKKTKRPLMSKETELEIVEKLKNGISQKAIADIFGVSKQTISRINVKHRTSN